MYLLHPAATCGRSVMKRWPTPHRTAAARATSAQEHATPPPSERPALPRQRSTIPHRRARDAGASAGAETPSMISPTSRHRPCPPPPPRLCAHLGVSKRAPGFKMLRSQRACAVREDSNLHAGGGVVPECIEFPAFLGTLGRQWKRQSQTSEQHGAVLCVWHDQVRAGYCNAVRAQLAPPPPPPDQRRWHGRSRWLLRQPVSHVASSAPVVTSLRESSLSDKNRSQAAVPAF